MEHCWKVQFLAQAPALQSVTITDMHPYASIGTSVGVAVGRRSGGRLATTLVDLYFHRSFLFLVFFSVVYFSHRRSARIKNLFSES